MSTWKFHWPKANSGVWREPGENRERRGQTFSCSGVHHDKCSWLVVEAFQVGLVGNQCGRGAPQATVLEKIQPNGGGPITIGVSNEESSGGAHLGSGIPARTSNRAQYGGVRPGDCVVICFLAKVLQSRPTKNED